MSWSGRDLGPALWPVEEHAQALWDLAAAAGLRPHGQRGPVQATSGDEAEDRLGGCMEAAAQAARLEAQTVEVRYGDARSMLRRSAPALLRVEGDGGEVHLLALLKGGRRLTLLARDGTRITCDREDLRDAWCAGLERQIEERVASMLDAAGLPETSRAAARRALMAEHLDAVSVGGAWLLGLPPERSFWEQMRRARLPVVAGGVLLTGWLASTLGLLAWIPLGRSVLSGSPDPGWMLAWALLLIGAIPLRGLESWLQASFGLRFGRLLRRRLMAGATRIPARDMRGEGAGALLARVLESEALESNLLSGGFVLAGASIDVVLAGWVLAQGPAAALSMVLLAGVLLLAVGLGLRFYRAARKQLRTRLELTSHLVERITGQATRAVQEHPADWHREEDGWLVDYVESSKGLDRASLWLSTLLALLWLGMGTMALCSAFVAGRAGPVDLAIGVGAVLLGTTALGRLGSGICQLGTSLVAWKQVQPLFVAARQTEPLGAGAGSLVADRRPVSPDELLVRARGLSFRPEGRDADVLRGVDFDLCRGDRILLEGPSGGGKSTLIRLLAGLAEPTAGSLTLLGLDRGSHGAERWRRQIAAAPQFHENYVFSGTFAFNLLLASPEELDDSGEGGTPNLSDPSLQAKAEA